MKFRKNPPKLHKFLQSLNNCVFVIVLQHNNISVSFSRKSKLQFISHYRKIRFP